MAKNSAIPVHPIEQRILLFRGHRVLVDSDLATLYEVPTKALLQALKRNRERFPQDFVFRLTAAETSTLRSQSVTSKRGGRRYLPYVFTEQGVAMLSSILRSKTAIAVNISIMRAFVRLRQSLHAEERLIDQIDELEKRVTGHDRHIASIFETIRRMIERPVREKRRIGY